MHHIHRPYDEPSDLRRGDEHPAYPSVVSVLGKRLAGKSVPEITYLVSSGTLNLNSVNQPSLGVCDQLTFACVRVTVSDVS